jgi:hypothetical protein
MILTVYLDEQIHQIDVPAVMLKDASDFFDKMDADMDNGWMMSREFVDMPTVEQRCQIAADRILDAMSQGNETLAKLMAGYILTRMQDVLSVEIDSAGEMMNTRFERVAGGQVTINKLTEEEARKRAEQDISRVYKVGRIHRFSVYDPLSKKWVESPAIDSQQNAEQQRTAMVEEKVGEWMTIGVRELL